jgi:hypothetical protein
MFAPVAQINSDGVEEERVLVNTTTGKWNRTYRMHGDPSKSNANFSFAGGHLELFPDGFYHAIIDIIKVWQPSDFPVDPVAGIPWVDYPQIEDEIIDICKHFPVSELSFDQFSSTSSIQRIRNGVTKSAANKQMVIREINFNATENWRRFEQFKTAAYMGWVHTPVVMIDYPGAGTVNLLGEELKFLQEKSGRVDKQTVGRIVTKDLADCVMVVVTELLKDQLSTLVSQEFDNRRLVGAAQGGYTVEGAIAAQQRPAVTINPLQVNPFGGSFDALYRGRKGKIKG